MIAITAYYEPGDSVMNSMCDILTRAGLYADHQRYGILRPLIIAEKERRRLAVGEHLTLLFENRQTACTRSKR